MKMIVYARAQKHGMVSMWTRLEEEPNYDTPRVNNMMLDIKEDFDRIIDKCEQDSCVVHKKKSAA